MKRLRKCDTFVDLVFSSFGEVLFLLLGRPSVNEIKTLCLLFFTLELTEFYAGVY